VSQHEYVSAAASSSRNRWVSIVNASRSCSPIFISLTPARSKRYIWMELLERAEVYLGAMFCEDLQAPSSAPKLNI